MELLQHLKRKPMYSDLKDYKPSNVEYVVSDDTKSVLPEELDFFNIEDANIKSPMEAINFIAEKFIATFPHSESAFRKLDDFEIKNIREEYCVLQEYEIPKRKKFLEDTLEEIKLMKKRAEESYNSILSEVAKYAAEVRVGTRELVLSSQETFSIAIAGMYAIYTYDKQKKKFVLAKAYPILDRTELWASESANREAMLELFGIELPEVKKLDGNDDNNEGEKPLDDLPFGN